jgi:hypothetical protein
MRLAREFYARWFFKTVWRAPGAADGYAGLFGTVVGIAQHYRPELSSMTEGWFWQVPLWTFGAVLIVRFLAAPFEIWKEDQRKLAQLKTSGDLRSQRRDLGRLLSQCEHIIEQCDTPVPVNEPMVEEWFRRTVEFLANDLGEEYVHRFRSDAGLNPLVLTSPSVPERNRDLWAFLHRRAARLHSFLEEMSKQTAPA